MFMKYEENKEGDSWNTELERERERFKNFSVLPLKKILKVFPKGRKKERESWGREEKNENKIVEKTTNLK